MLLFPRATNRGHLLSLSTHGNDHVVRDIHQGRLKMCQLSEQAPDNAPGTGGSTSAGLVAALHPNKRPCRLNLLPEPLSHLPLDMFDFRKQASGEVRQAQ